jgi:hypothetical protein
MSLVVHVLSGEFVLRGRANGGTAVLLRSVFVTALIYVPTLAFKSYLSVGSELVFSPIQMQAEILDTLPWIGAIFAGSYAALYSRFSTQWGYLANLYNQIMSTCASMPEKQRKNNPTLATWQAAFIEDAQDLHLARKPMFSSIIRCMLLQDEIRQEFLDSTSDGARRLAKLEKQLSIASAETDAGEIRPSNGASSTAAPDHPRYNL